MFNASKFAGDWQCPGREKLNCEQSGSFSTGQNLEAYVYGKRLKGEAYRGLSEYCVEDLDALRDFDFDLVSDPEIRCFMEKTGSMTPYLEIEAPFSVLAGIMDPMKLYACKEEDLMILREVLHKIADAQSIYIDACVKAGCRLFSLADPVGSLNLVGEDYFREVVGESEVYLMKKCVASFEKTPVNLCPLMDRSLAMTGMDREIPCRYRSVCLASGKEMEKKCER